MTMCVSNPANWAPFDLIISPQTLSTQLGTQIGNTVLLLFLSSSYRPHEPQKSRNTDNMIFAFALVYGQAMSTGTCGKN